MSNTLNDFITQLCMRFVNENALPPETFHQLRMIVLNSFRTNFIFTIEQIPQLSIDDIQKIGVPIAFAVFLMNEMSTQQNVPFSIQHFPQQPFVDIELKEHQKQNNSLQQVSDSQYETPAVPIVIHQATVPVVIQPEITNSHPVVAITTVTAQQNQLGGLFVSLGFILCIVGIFFPVFLWFGTFVFFMGCFYMCSSNAIAKANGHKCFLGFIISGIFTGLEIGGIIGAAVGGVAR